MNNNLTVIIVVYKTNRIILENFIIQIGLVKNSDLFMFPRMKFMGLWDGTASFQKQAGLTLTLLILLQKLHRIIWFIPI